MRYLLLARAAPAALLLVLAACGREARDALRRLQPASPHERYAQALRDAGLADAALGRDWLGAADGALRAPLVVSLPYRETGWFDAGEARAVGLRVQPRRGRRLSVRVEPAPGASPAALFLDVFEVDADSAAARATASAPTPPRRVASADGGVGTRAVDVDVDREGVAYLVRLQPELLRGGRYTLTIEAGPSLAFPVSGRSSAAVQSFWGVGRDAGRRRHEGVDVFAPRGTPALAATDGIVTNTGTTALGGKVVWLRDAARGQALYYAHLDSQIARPGQRVRAGDTLGLVGNTGNARTTAPHLHFGVYSRGWGAVDPFPFIDTRRRDPPRVVADTAALGELRRVAARDGAPLTTAPGARPTGRLPAGTVLRVDAAAGALYRVRLPDGSGGYVAARLTTNGHQSLAAALPGRRGGGPRPVHEGPAVSSVVIDSLPPAEAGATAVLGRWNDFLLVRTPRGRLGWLDEAG